MYEDLKQTLKRFIPSSLVVATRPMRQYFDPQRRFDRRFGVDTSGTVNVDRLDVTDGIRPHASGYEATPPAMFARIMKNMPVSPEGYVLVDMGSGKGPVLLYALDYPFKDIVGIELSPQLHATAQRNLAALRNRASGGHSNGRARSLLMSAADFEFPPDPMMIFLGNPFKGALLKTVVENLRRSIRKHPRDVLVAYYHRLSRHGEWDHADFLTTVHREQSHTIYRNKG
jgi:hypothetical protein